ncbi:hypothetical protein [[Eubacterium] cellulosolvens]
MKLLKTLLTLIIIVTAYQPHLTSASLKTELIMNGDFESDLDEWEPYFYHETHGNVAITAGIKHSGIKSVRTWADPNPQSTYSTKKGGGATQIVQNNINNLDLILSFWVLPAVSGRNDHTNIRTIIQMKLEDDRAINLSYYVAWAPTAIGEFLYNTSDNTIFFLLEDMQDMTPMPEPQTPQPESGVHQWTFIKRNLGNDFFSKHGNPQNIILEEISVSFELTTVSHLQTPDAFWDEISLIAETENSQPEPTITSTLKSEPLEPIITSTPRLDSSKTITYPHNTSQPIEENQLKILTDNYGIIIIITLIIIAILVFVFRKKSDKKKRPIKYCMNCGATIEVMNDFCERCGTKKER